MHARDRGLNVPLEIEHLADVFVEVADTLVADFDLIEFLHTVARHAADIGGAAAAGLMLSGQDGTLHHIGASSEDARLLELFQIQNDEGPCLVAYRTGRQVVVPDLTEGRGRWPRFADRALAAGVASVYAFPMRLRDQMIGGLNVFLIERRDLDEGDARLLQALADLATISLIQEQAVARADVLTEQLQAALNSRIVIEQAKGAVARTFGISVDEAFTMLRGHARTSRRRLTEVAHEVVTSADGPGLLRPE
jgi:GAF domain-containing protein